MRILTTVIGVLIAFAGLICLIKPGIAAVVVAYAVSVALIVGGIIFLVNYYGRKKGQKWQVFAAVVMEIFGVVLLFNAVEDIFSVRFIAVMTGFVILLAGVGGIFGAVKLKKMDRPWIITMIIGVVSAAIGVFAVINPFRGYFMLNLMFSLSLIAQGVNFIVTGAAVEKKPEEPEMTDGKNLNREE